MTSRPCPAHRLRIRIGSTVVPAAAPARRRGPGAPWTARAQPPGQPRRRVLVGLVPAHPVRFATGPAPDTPPVASVVSGWSPAAITAHRRVDHVTAPAHDRIPRRAVSRIMSPANEPGRAPRDQVHRLEAPAGPRPGRDLPASGARTALDLFTGTTRVAQAFKAQGVHVTAADSARYAHVFARTYIETDAADHRHQRAAGGRRPPQQPSPARRATSPRRSAGRPASSNRTTPLGSTPSATPSTSDYAGSPSVPPPVDQPDRGGGPGRLDHRACRWPTSSSGRRARSTRSSCGCPSCSAGAGPRHPAATRWR